MPIPITDVPFYLRAAIDLDYQIRRLLISIDVAPSISLESVHHSVLGHKPEMQPLIEAIRACIRNQIEARRAERDVDNPFAELAAIANEEQAERGV
jgi:hypothetical protein